MDTSESDGKALHDPDAEVRRQAARAMGSARTERKIQASRANAAIATESRRGKPLAEETRALLSQKQKERRERERQEREAAGVGIPEAPKRGRGRPKKEQEGTTA